MKGFLEMVAKYHNAALSIAAAFASTLFMIMSTSFTNVI